PVVDMFTCVLVGLVVGRIIDRELLRVIWSNTRKSFSELLEHAVGANFNLEIFLLYFFERFGFPFLSSRRTQQIYGDDVTCLGWAIFDWDQLGLTLSQSIDSFIDIFVADFVDPLCQRDLSII